MASNYGTQFAEPPPAQPYGVPPQYAQDPQQPPQYAQDPQQYGQQPQYAQQQQYGQQQQQQYSMPPQYGGQQQQYAPPAQDQQYFPNASAPAQGARPPLRRSLSLCSAQLIQKQMSAMSFDPYASAPAEDPFASQGNELVHAPPPAAAPPVYNNYSSMPAGSMSSIPAQGQEMTSLFPDEGPPAFGSDDMTTSPHPDQFGFAQQPPAFAQSMPVLPTGQQPPFDPTSSDAVSDISMFSSAPPMGTGEAALTGETALVVAGETALVHSDGSQYSEKEIEQQKKIYAQIQARNKKKAERAAMKKSAPPTSTALVPAGRNLPRSRSMPNPKTAGRGQKNSIARGGVAVLDPKKDLRKQTRKMKTTTGAVAGAVVGGLCLGPVGAVLGGGGGAAVANKVAKSRDKRKQAQFEQKNFQKGAAQSHAAKKGASAFV